MHIITMLLVIHIQMVTMEKNIVIVRQTRQMVLRLEKLIRCFYMTVMSMEKELMEVDSNILLRLVQKNFKKWV